MNSRPVYEIAEYLISGWLLANPGVSLPINDGRLDIALHHTIQSKHLPHVEILSFGNTRTGFRCYELHDILHAAFNNLLLSAPTPAHSMAKPIIDSTTALSLLRRRNLNVDDAKSFATELLQQIPIT